jgi:hypothetical protein
MEVAKRHARAIRLRKFLRCCTVLKIDAVISSGAAAIDRVALQPASSAKDKWIVGVTAIAAVCYSLFSSAGSRAMQQAAFWAS